MRILKIEFAEQICTVKTSIMYPKKFTLKYQHSHINYYTLPVTPFTEFNVISLLKIRF